MVRLLKFGILVAIAGGVGAGPDPAIADSPQASAATSLVPVWKRIRYGNPRALQLRSQVGLVVDEQRGVILYARDTDKPRPIASLTKLLTVMTLLDAKLYSREGHRDHRAGSGSPEGFAFEPGIRHQADTGRADAHSHRRLGQSRDCRARAYLSGWIRGLWCGVMNEKARTLGLAHTRAADASGLQARQRLHGS